MRHHNEPIVGLSTSSWSRDSWAYGLKSISGLPTGKRSYDQNCNSRGHPKKMGSSAETFVMPVQRALYVTANTTEDQLNYGMSSSGASAIDLAKGTSYLGHESPSELQNMTQPNSHSK